MKNTKKKGFTIVELVIVIAVIAILAAVLIPTFAGIVKKANLSADQQAVAQMNTVLTGTECATIEDAAKVLAENGYNDELIPTSKYHSFYWYKTYNKVVLVNEKDGAWTLVAPTNDSKLSETFANDKDTGVFYNLMHAHATTEIAGTNVADINTALKDSQNIKVTAAPEKFTLENTSADQKLDGRQVGFVVPKDAVTTIDLGGNTVEAASDVVAIAVEGEARITNGTVSTRSLYVAPGATLIIEDNVTVIANAADGGAAIRNYGTVIINGGVFKAEGGDMGEDVIKEPACVHNFGTMTINGGTFTANSSCYAVVNNGTLTINEGTTITATRGCIAIEGGIAVINGGTFTVLGQEVNEAYVVYFAGANMSTCTINGGTFVQNGNAAVFSGADLDGFTDNRAAE